MPRDMLFDDILLARVRDLRAAGRSPKEIARALALRPSAVAPLVRALARDAAVAETEPAVVGCWVSPGWSTGLHIDGREDWPDTATPDNGTAGLAGVVVARRHRPHRVSVAGFLVDTYCLGVKNALGPDVMNERDLPTFLSRFFSAFGDTATPLAAPLDLARQLVWGATDSARRLGFEPHRDFAPAAGHLGSQPEASTITFGREGVPFYVSGPDDNPNAVLRTLTRTVGEGNFEYLMSVGTAAAW